MVPTRYPLQVERLQAKGWKLILHANGNDMKVGVGNTHIRQKSLKKLKYKEGHYIMIKKSLQEEDITLVNIYAFNIGIPKHIEKVLTDIKGKVDRNTTIEGDFNTP